LGNKDSPAESDVCDGDDAVGEENVNGSSNHLVVLRTLHLIDFVSGYVDMCPTSYGVPESRPRIYYVGFKIVNWMSILSLSHERCEEFLINKLPMIIATVRSLANKLEETPLSAYLVPKTHALHEKMLDQAEAKVGARAVRAKTDLGWVKMHSEMFKSKQLDFHHPRFMDVARYGLENAFYNNLTPRERSILFFFDETAPPVVHDEIINTPCPKIMFLFRLYL
jgi:hypothetical protein